MTQQVPAYILAGGRSSRFGSDKARAAGSDGRPLIVRIAEIIRPVADVVVIAEREGKYQDLGLTTIPDETPGLGPMAGLQAALHHCKCDWLLLLSCDLLTVRREWIESLLSARTEAADVIAFRDDYWEPLCALYNTRLCEEVDRRIERSQLAMQSLLNSAGCEALPRPAGFAQANTPEELLRAMTRTHTVLLFGPLAQAYGAKQIEVASGAAATTCADLRIALAEQCPAIARLLPSCRFAVNNAFVPETTQLKGDEEIALIGFVSGG